MLQKQEVAFLEVMGELSSTIQNTSCSRCHNETNKDRTYCRQHQQQPQQRNRRRNYSFQRQRWTLQRQQQPFLPCLFVWLLLFVVVEGVTSSVREEERKHHHHLLLRHSYPSQNHDTKLLRGTFTTTSITTDARQRDRRLHNHPHDESDPRSSSEASAPKLELEKIDGDEEESFFDKDPNSPMAYANLKSSSSNVARSTASTTQKAKYIGQRGTSCRDINGRHGKEGYHYVSVGRKDSDDPSSLITLQECIDLCTSNDFSNGRNSLEQQEERASGDGPEPSSMLFTTSNANSEFCYGFQFLMVNGTAANNGSVYNRPDWGPRRQGGGGGLGSASSSNHQQGNIHQQGVTGGVFGKHQSKNGCRLWKRPIESIQRGKGKQQRQYCFRKLGAPSLPIVVQSRTHITTNEGEESSVEDTSSEQCPKPRLAPCTREYDPVICDYSSNGEDKPTSSKMIQCEYDNTCIAKLAGFTDVEIQCIHQIDLVIVEDNNEEDTVDTNNTTTGVISTKNETNDENEDVFFGGDDNEEEDEDLNEGVMTEDSELPTAQSRTYDTTNQCPKPALKPCTREYDPVYCDYQGISCKYSNACIARLAGFQNPHKNCIRERDYDESIAEKKKKKKRLGQNKMNKWQVKPRTTIVTTDNATESDTNNTTAFLGNVTDCPLPDPDGYCPLIYQPVLCLDECRYSNGCFAQLAGFNVTLANSMDNEDLGDDCILVEDDDEDVSVETAVQIEEDSPIPSTGTCPPPDPNGICPLVYNPVVCSYSNNTSNTTTTCEYSNDCFAALAGWNTQENCIPKCTFVPEFGVENTTSVVPKLDDTEGCGLHNTFNPVICGHSRHKIEPQYDNQKGCLYDNKCVAKQLGIANVEETCELYCPGVILKEEGTFIDAYSFGYPSPGGSSDMQLQPTLTMSLDECLNDHSNTLGNSGPVVCGQNQCQYDNLCYATLGAGFDQDQCTSVNNDDEEDEDDDTRSTMTCPTPDLNGICPLLYQPVVCSSPANSTTSNITMTCDYSNQCFAELAGWTEEECVPKQCINEDYIIIETNTTANSSSTSESCEGIHNVYNPMICGHSDNRISPMYNNQQKGCIFENKCEAEQSGLFLAVTDCELYCPGILTAEVGSIEQAQAIGLPAPAANCPECTSIALDDCLKGLLLEEVRPVVCGLNKCQYDTICFATVGAGFDQDQCIYTS